MAEKDDWDNLASVNGLNPQAFVLAPQASVFTPSTSDSQGIGRSLDVGHGHQPLHLSGYSPSASSIGSSGTSSRTTGHTDETSLVHSTTQNDNHNKVRDLARFSSLQVEDDSSQSQNRKLRTIPSDFSKQQHRLLSSHSPPTFHNLHEWCCPPLSPVLSPRHYRPSEPPARDSPLPPTSRREVRRKVEEWLRRSIEADQEADMEDNTGHRGIKSMGF